MAAAADHAESLDRLQEQTGGQAVDGTVGMFAREKVYSEKLSTEADETVYLIHDYCYIRTPGNAKAEHKELIRKTFPDGREVIVNEFHTRKYSRAWDAFLRGEDLKPEGTPIDECSAIPRERLAGLKKADVRTVEELAHLPDRSLQRVGADGRALQKAALAYIAEHDAGAQALEELKALREELAELKGATDNGDNTDSGPKRSGRPRSKAAE